jgi:hypothetical protein
MVGRRKHPEPLPSPAVREVEGKDVSEGVQTSPMLKPKRRTIRQRLPMKLIFFSCFVGGIVASRAYFPDYVHASSELFVPVGALVEELSRPGLNFSNESVVCRRPFVALPGFVTSALEIWEPLPCATSALTTNFRKQLFGAGMLLTLLDDPECFFRHAALDPDTSLDPEGIKMRAATGFSAIDYIVPGFWVWAKVLRNLADIGYTPHTLHAATYDWRLSPEELASPAVGYFEDLKGDIERLSRRAQRKELPELSKKAREAEGCDRVVIASHSYGSNVLVAFLQWAEDQEPGWTDKNVHAVANIGGPMLGMPKALSALVSGEFRDTAVLPRPIRQLVDLSIPKRLRAWTFRTWSCLWTMLPKSDAIWPRIVDVPLKGEADKTQEGNGKATNSEETKEKKESTAEDTSTCEVRGRFFCIREERDAEQPAAGRCGGQRGAAAPGRDRDEEPPADEATQVVQARQDCPRGDPAYPQGAAGHHVVSVRSEARHGGGLPLFGRCCRCHSALCRRRAQRLRHPHR